MAVLVVGVLALVGSVLVNLLSRYFENGFNRWIQESHWNGRLFVAITVTLAVATAAVARHPGEPGGRRSTRSTTTTTGAPAVPSFDERLAVEQRRVQSLRIGLPEEDLRHHLGPPQGRFAAPGNPYGIETEIVWRNDLTIIQVLLGSARSVVYYAITAVDVAAKIETPLRLNEEAAAGKTFVLHETPIAAVDGDHVTLFGALGASWYNFGVTWGGSHAASYRYEAVGLHVLGGTYDRGVLRESHSAEAEDVLRQALYDSSGRSFEEQGDWEAYEEQRTRDCLQLREEQARDGDLDLAVLRQACLNDHIPEDEQRRIRSTPEWAAYVQAGTANTFAETASHLFDDYDAKVFYSIFDLGPREESY